MTASSGQGAITGSPWTGQPDRAKQESSAAWSLPPRPLILLNAVDMQCQVPNWCMSCMSSLSSLSVCWANFNHWFNCMSLSLFNSLRISSNVFGSDSPPHFSPMPPPLTPPTSIPQSVKSCLLWLSNGGIKMCFYGKALKGSGWTNLGNDSAFNTVLLCFLYKGIYIKTSTALVLFSTDRM